MFFYLIAPIGVRSPLLSYTSHIPLSLGIVVAIPIRKKLHSGVVIATSEKPEFACKPITQILGQMTHIQRFLAHFIARYYHASLSESYKLCVPFMFEYPHQSLSRTTLIHKPLHYNPGHIIGFSHSPHIAPLNDEKKREIKRNLCALSHEQQQAYNFIESKPLSLLFGDTGSGKTEIYFHCIAKALSQDKSALFLMPEIALTPQILARLQRVFGDCVALWHSKISKTKKQQILADIQAQKIKIIAGARSALFLPLAHIGVIIVDEEHDEAYKAMNNPRYNARDMAILLSKRARIKVVLGSATPSITSYKLACDGNYLYRLRGRFYKPRKHIHLESSKTAISQALLTHLDSTLAQGKQAIVFVPTRANFKALLCCDCGYGFACPFCSVNMSVHSKENALVCHYCGYRQALAHNCPECHGTELSSKRIGTAQIAHELQEALPQAKIGIFDRDHTSTHKKLTTLLSDFKHKNIDVLVGTQMLSKGHDYHNVALACVLGIDHILQGGDYRSFERGMALLHQIAGRAGRKDEGAVFIQSLQSEWIAPFLNDYEVFLRWELEHRSRVYPPHNRLMMIHCDDVNRSKAEQKMLALESALKQYIQETNTNNTTSKANNAYGQLDEGAANRDLSSSDGSGFAILGSGANAIERIANKWRFHILLHAKSHTKLLNTISKLEREFGEIDVDIDCLDTL